MKKRLKSKRGESLAEALIAILISSVALVMLSSTITKVQRHMDTTESGYQQIVENISDLTMYASGEKSLENEYISKANATITFVSSDAVSNDKVTLYSDSRMSLIAFRKR